MSLAKAVVTGTVYRKAKVGYSSNDIAVSDFIMNIGERDEILVRVISKRQALQDTVNSLKKGEKILVEGRLQTAQAKMEDGTEKRIYEIDANSIEKFGSSSAADGSVSEDIVKFESDDMANELINGDEIPF